MGSQVHNGKYADPDDVERVPEQAKAEKAAADHGLKSERRHLQEHDDEPAQAQGHMQSMSAHQGEEGRKKGTAGRPRADTQHVTELAHFETQKRDPQNEGDCHPKISRPTVSALHRERTKTAGDARCLKAGGLNQYMLLVEQV